MKEWSPAQDLLDKGPTCSSTHVGEPTRTVFYHNLKDWELREHAQHTGPGNYEKYDRKMLMALLLNRNRCGYFIEVQDPEPGFS